MDVGYKTCGIEVPAGAEETLACFNCDCDSPNSIVEAVRQGWTDIEFWDGHSAYFIGVCPSCRDAAHELAVVANSE